MNIECPHCNTENTIENADNIHCQKCEKSFKGFAFRKYKTSIIGTGVALMLGAYAGQKVDGHFFEPKRYSTAAIYEIVSYCANPTEVLFTQARQQKLAETCICALNKTMSQISEVELKTRSSEFKKLFNQHVAVCR